MKLTRYLLGILLLTVVSSTWAQSHIIWGEKEVKWNDFKGKPDRKSAFKAITHSEMHAPSSWNKDTLNIEIVAKFSRLQSWTKDKSNVHLLKHEKLHFDITEYHARLLRKAVLRYKFSSVNEVGNEVAKLFNQYHKKSREMQRKYDKESDHSRDKAGQEKWDQKVAALLEKTAEYTQTKHAIYIGYLKK